jgi:hypothetical protein
LFLKGLGGQTTAAIPACEEKARLVRLYAFATSDYQRAVLVLHERLGVMSKKEYQEIRAFAEKTRELADQARAALDQHTNEHGC